MPRGRPFMSDPNQPAPAAELDQAKGQYVVVARRYRPQTFAELIGQQHVAQALSGAIASDRVGHAYLFTGARGVGKTSAARILAKALNCVEGPTAVPCNECEICRSVSSGGDVDVLEIDGASNRGIDEIRQLRQNVAVRPSRARYKIYIIDEVHMLTKEAFNALLKTLEEPPEHVKFIFATTEPNKIPVTILSRCQRYDFAGIEATAIEDRLRQIVESEGVAAETDALQLLAMRASGSMRDSQSLLEQLLSTGKEQLTVSDVTELLGIAPAARLSGLVEPITERNPAAALEQLDDAISEGAEPGQLIDQLLGFFRDVMVRAAGCEESQMMYVLPAQRDEVSRLAGNLGLETILAMVQILDQAAARLRVSTQSRTLAEMAIVRMTQLGDLDRVADLIEALGPPTGPQAAAGAASDRARASQRSGRQSADARTPQASVGDRQATREQTTATSSDAARASSSPADSAPANSAPPNSASPTAAAATTPLATTPRPTVAATASDQPTPHEAPPPVEGTSVEEAAQLDPERIAAQWQEAASRLTGMLPAHAAAASKVTIDGEGQVVASFAGDFAFSKNACERPEARTRIETALGEVCGGRVSVVFASHQAEADQRPTPPKAASRREQQANAAAQPFVRKAMELFDVDETRLRYIPPDPAG